MFKKNQHVIFLSTQWQIVEVKDDLALIRNMAAKLRQPVKKVEVKHLRPVYDRGRY